MNYLDIALVKCDLCGVFEPNTRYESPSVEIQSPEGRKKGRAIEWLICARCSEALHNSDMNQLLQAAQAKILLTTRMVLAEEIIPAMTEFLKQERAAIVSGKRRTFNARTVDYAYHRPEGIAPGSLAEKIENDAHTFLSQVPVSRIHNARAEFRARYGFAIPTAEALDTIAKNSKSGLIDFGSGNGYWSYLLRKRGLYVDCVDRSPIGLGKNRFWKNLGYEYKYGVTAWTDIRIGSYEALRDSTCNSLLFIWPPHDDVMASTALRRFKGDILIYGGELQAGMTGDTRFYEMLDTDWRVSDVVSLPTLYGCQDTLRVLRRTVSKRPPSG